VLSNVFGVACKAAFVLYIAIYVKLFNVLWPFLNLFTYTFLLRMPYGLNFTIEASQLCFSRWFLNREYCCDL